MREWVKAALRPLVKPGAAKQRALPFSDRKEGLSQHWGDSVYRGLEVQERLFFAVAALLQGSVAGCVALPTVTPTSLNKVCVNFSVPAAHRVCWDVTEVMIPFPPRESRDMTRARRRRTGLMVLARLTVLWPTHCCHHLVREVRER